MVVSVIGNGNLTTVTGLYTREAREEIASEIVPSIFNEGTVSQRTELMLS